MIEIVQLACLQDNYGFLLHEPESGTTASIDTPDPQAILTALAERNWDLHYIWNTHHHWDHIGGNEALQKATHCKIFGPAHDGIRGLDKKLQEGDKVQLGKTSFSVLEIGGHTKGHIGYYSADEAVAFVGDTLFSMGCGRLFEGTPTQMWQSLQKLMRLPKQTKIYCAHEYTEQNARFALSIDTNNPALKKRADEVTKLRKQGKPTIPTNIAQELATNPFLRAKNADDFARIRKAKDNF